MTVFSEDRHREILSMTVCDTHRHRQIASMTVFFTHRHRRCRKDPSPSGTMNQSQISTTDRTHARTGPDTQRAQAHCHTQTTPITDREVGVGAGSLKILTGVLVHRVTRPLRGISRWPSFSRTRDYHISRCTRHELQAHHGHVALLNRPRAGPAFRA